MQDLPGQTLFQYLDEDREPRTIDSEDVNAYLHGIAGAEFTAKDFRTWAGTVLAAHELRRLGPAATQTARKANIIAAVDAVAARLGNTRAVCRASYIHPLVLSGYETSNLCTFESEAAPIPGLHRDERWTLAYLKSGSR
jgi:DNA topoisomerase-1